VALEPEFAARLEAAQRDGRERLTAAEGRLDRAGERARYVLKDRGSREQVVVREPSYATVLLLSRHADSFAGLRIEESSERVVQRDERGLAIARGLVGGVGQLDLREQLVEGEVRREFNELRARSQRSEAEDDQLRYLARHLVRGDELRGRSGLEGNFQNELAGSNATEVRGLQNQLEGVYLVDVAPVDGLDLVLTLELELQQAATACLGQPEGPPNVVARDTAWLERPTGAIVLAQVDGDVLAAASFPDFLRDEGDAPATRDLPLERTLRKGAFEPPGSSSSSFVASYALSELSLDPSQTCLCAPLPSGRGAGYVDVRCAYSVGHGPVGLRYAIQHSCNSYFARLGERFSPDDWRAMAAEFGFGQPTGVRTLGTRSGLSEHTTSELFRRNLTQRESRLAGNGLALVEATPMQLARATAGLATGVLPQMRLVRSIGGVEQPQSARPLALVRQRSRSCTRWKPSQRVSSHGPRSTRTARLPHGGRRARATSTRPSSSRPTAARACASTRGSSAGFRPIARAGSWWCSARTRCRPRATARSGSRGSSCGGPRCRRSCTPRSNADGHGFRPAHSGRAHVLVAPRQLDARRLARAVARPVPARAGVVVRVGHGCGRSRARARRRQLREPGAQGDAHAAVPRSGAPAAAALAAQERELGVRPEPRVPAAGADFRRDAQQRAALDSAARRF
jgi:hypothetical protein